MEKVLEDFMAELEKVEQKKKNLKCLKQKAN